MSRKIFQIIFLTIIGTLVNWEITGSSLSLPGKENLPK